MAVTSEQLRELNAALLQFHVQMRAERNDDRLNVTEVGTKYNLLFEAHILELVNYSKFDRKRVLSLISDNKMYCLLVFVT